LIKTKERGQKKYLIMGKQAQTIELSTDLGINYIPCYIVVLMQYNYLLNAIVKKEQ